MHSSSEEFLLRLLETASPSGFEADAAAVWRAEAETFAHEVSVDSFGNSYARLRGGGPRVMIEGHIDEIGVMVTHIDSSGFLWFRAIGGWDAQVLVGQRVRLLGEGGPVLGVVGKKAAHQMTPADREKASSIESLWIDIGAADADSARSRIEVGDAGVIEQPTVRIGEDFIAARGMDNRAGAFVALEALRELSADDSLNVDVWAVAAAQEEIGLHGARTSAFGLEPDVAIVIDVSHATDHPEADVRGLGPRKLGGGAVLTRGSAVHPRVYELLRETARAGDIPWMIEPKPARTGTDADAISDSRAGVPTGLVKIPTRYMHSSNELVSLADMDRCVQVIAGFVRRLNTDTSFDR